MFRIDDICAYALHAIPMKISSRVIHWPHDSRRHQREENRGSNGNDIRGLLNIVLYEVTQNDETVLAVRKLCHACATILMCHRSLCTRHQSEVISSI
jgi:hypothetical protein